jgi:hypothetical protein
MRVESNKNIQRCLRVVLFGALWGCGGPEKASAVSARGHQEVEPAVPAVQPANAPVLTPVEFPEDSFFYSEANEPVVSVLGKEYSAFKYCSDGFNQPTIEVFAVEGHDDRLVYLCYSPKKRKANQVTIFHASEDPKSTSLEPGATHRIRDEEFHKLVGQLLALPTPADRSTLPSTTELEVACTALRSSPPYKLETQAVQSSYDQKLLVATCTGSYDASVQVFDAESGRSFVASGIDCTSISSDGRYLACNESKNSSLVVDVQASLADPAYRVRGGKLFDTPSRLFVTKWGFALDVVGCTAHAKGPRAAASANCLDMQDGSDMSGFTRWLDTAILEGRWALGGSGPSAGAAVRFNTRTSVFTFPNYAVRVPKTAAQAIQAQAEKDATYSPLDERFYSKSEARVFGKALVNQGKTKSFRVVGREPTEFSLGSD